MSQISEIKTPQECADAWRRITKIYAETCKGSPAETVKRILDEYSLSAVLAVFSTIASIKSHDGRIYGRNREFISSIPVVEGAITLECGNPMKHAGLDDIHTTHIDQMIGELRKMCAGGAR